jgi:hypothetical protein
LIASSASQRPIVDADASLIACSTMKRCSSEREKRDSGTPCVLGSSHAIALTCATSRGGKTARATRALEILKPAQSPLAEASSPAPDRLARHPEPLTDLGVRQTLGRKQHQLGPLHLPVRSGVAGGAMLKLSPALAKILEGLIGNVDTERADRAVLARRATGAHLLFGGHPKLLNPRRAGRTFPTRS